MCVCVHGVLVLHSFHSRSMKRRGDDDDDDVQRPRTRVRPGPRVPTFLEDVIGDVRGEIFGHLDTATMLLLSHASTTMKSHVQDRLYRTPPSMLARDVMRSGEVSVYRYLRDVVGMPVTLFHPADAFAVNRWRLGTKVLLERLMRTNAVPGMPRADLTEEALYHVIRYGSPMDIEIVDEMRIVHGAAAGLDDAALNKMTWIATVLRYLDQDETRPSLTAAALTLDQDNRRMFTKNIGFFAAASDRRAEFVPLLQMQRWRSEDDAQELHHPVFDAFAYLLATGRIDDLDAGILPDIMPPVRDEVVAMMFPNTVYDGKPLTLARAHVGIRRRLWAAACVDPTELATIWYREHVTGVIVPADPYGSVDIPKAFLIAAVAERRRGNRGNPAPVSQSSGFISRLLDIPLPRPRDNDEMETEVEHDARLTRIVAWRDAIRDYSLLPRVGQISAAEIAATIETQITIAQRSNSSSSRTLDVEWWRLNFPHDRAENISEEGAWNILMALITYVGDILYVAPIVPVIFTSPLISAHGLDLLFNALEHDMGAPMTLFTRLVRYAVQDVDERRVDMRWYKKVPEDTQSIYRIPLPRDEWFAGRLADPLRGAGMWATRRVLQILMSMPLDERGNSPLGQRPYWPFKFTARRSRRLSEDSGGRNNRIVATTPELVALFRGEALAYGMDAKATLEKSEPEVSDAFDAAIVRHEWQH